MGNQVGEKGETEEARAETGTGKAAVRRNREEKERKNRRLSSRKRKRGGRKEAERKWKIPKARADGKHLWNSCGSEAGKGERKRTVEPSTGTRKDAILREEFDLNGLAGKVWQYFIAVPDIKSVGVKDDSRYEGWPAIIRAVNTVDAMTATIEEIPYAVLHKVTARITSEVEGINRVLYDLTPKPTGTIEWE